MDREKESVTKNKTLTKEDVEWLISNYDCIGDLKDLNLEDMTKILEKLDDKEKNT